MSFVRLFCIVVLLGVAFSSTAQMVGASDSLRRQAMRMESSFIAGDIVSYVHYFPPKLIEVKGGWDSVVKRLVGSRNSMGNMKYDSVGLDTLSAFVNDSGLLQATLAEHTSVTIGHNRVVFKSTLICLSPDNGVHWTFVEPGDEGGIYQLRLWVPEISTKLTIPPQPPPQIFPKQ
jgi:hypothetical protein